MRKVNVFFQLCLLLLFLFSITGCIQRGHVRSGSVDVGSDDLNVRVSFNDRDRELIRHWYKEEKKHKKKKQKKTPPGLAKKGKLPPGLQKQLHRNGKLPPGLQGRHLPSDLDGRLSRLHGDYVRMKVGGDVVLMNRVTGIIFDIIYDLD